MKIPVKRGTREIIIPKITPASISPRRIEVRERGDARSLSYVFAFLSQGVIKGPTEEEVKNKVILIRPGTRTSGTISLPSEKAKKKNTGKRIPKIITGGLR